MASVIYTNMLALNSQRALSQSQNSLATSMQRLSTGLRINTAMDDAAGLGISDRMTTQVLGLDQAARNANDGISLSQVADGALSSITDILQRIRQLAVQSSNATNSTDDRNNLQQEVSMLLAQINSVATQTQFNGQNLLDGSLANAVFQVGANAGQTIALGGVNTQTNAIGGSVYAAGLTTAGTLASVSALTATFTSFANVSNGAAAGALTLNGYLGSTAVTTTAGESSRQLTSDINALYNRTGITAYAVTNAGLTFTAITTTSSTVLKIRGDNTNFITVSAAITAMTAAGTAAIVNAINTQQGATGVTASWDAVNQVVQLTNTSGNDIVVGLGQSNGTSINMAAYNASGTVGSMGTAVTATSSGFDVGGLITLSSSNGFTVQGSVANVGMMTTAVTATGSNFNALNSLSVSSFLSAQMTMVVIDRALGTVNGQRAQFGAMMSRMQQTVSNDQTSSTNVAAARSRIRDTDFAVETTNLTRSQILQQAGTAMLAQANQAPQMVLSLLK